jgi:hypothetical protein
MIMGADMSDTVDRRLEDHLALRTRIAADRRRQRNLTGRSLAATRNAAALLRQAFPAARFEIGSVTINARTSVSVTWTGAPSHEGVKHALAPLTADSRVKLQLHHEEELTRRRRLALRAAYWAVVDLDLEDTPQSLGERLTERLRDFIPSAGRP